jgi:hemoglobin/transferrin/lactoferrin receptor protein
MDNHISFSRSYFWTILFILLPSCSYSQTISLSGYIIDAAEHHPISHALVMVTETGHQTSTNDSGYFHFPQMPSGRYTLGVHHIAYAPIERRMILNTVDRDSLVLEMQSTLFPSDEVIVRSTRTLSNIKNTPYPSIVKTDEQLKKIPGATLSDIISRDPGIALVRDGMWETAVSIRGMSRSNIVSLIDNTRIETATDIAGALSLINTNDLERVETLKSPGSVLYGTGAFGGVLHFVTKRAQFSDQFQMNTEFSNALSSVNNGISHYLAFEGSSTRYAARISGSYRTAGNTTTPSGILQNSQYKDFNFLGSLGIKTIADHTLLLSYQRSQAEDTGIPGNSSFGVAATVRYVLAQRELFSAEYTIPNLSTLIPLFRVHISRQGISRNVEVIQGDTLRITPHAIHTTNNIQIESHISPLTDHLFVVGAEAWERELDSRREKILPKMNRLIGERPIPHSTYFSGGLFVQDEWNTIPSRLMITLGARYDWIRVRNNQVFNPEYTVAAGVYKTNTIDSTVLWQNGTAHDESWSASAGAQYTLDRYIDFTFLAATAFRSPSLEERYQFLDLGKGKIQIGDPSLQPERSVSFNTGIHVHTSELKLQTELYLNILSNLIKAVQGTFKGQSALVNTNISQARIYGFEFSFEKTLTSLSVFKGSLAYVRGEDTRIHANLSQIAPLSGQGELTGYFQNIGTLSLSCSAMAAQNNLAVGETHTAGWVTLDAGYISIPMKAGRWTITFHSGVQNIFNTAYRNFLSTLRGIIKEEPGRNYYLSADITF